MGELITLTEAAERAGLSLMTFRKRIREHKLTVYINPRDKREKLVDTAEVDEMMTPTPMYAGEEGKAAA